MNKLNFNWKEVKGRLQKPGWDKVWSDFKKLKNKGFTKLKAQNYYPPPHLGILKMTILAEMASEKLHKYRVLRWRASPKW